MHRGILLMSFLAALSLGHAHAQSCSTASSSGISASAIQSLVANQYACVGTSPNAEWNELHNSNGRAGNVLDYKKGPKDPVDPSDTASHPTGSYVIAGSHNNPGTITYTYGTNAYGYYVVDTSTAPVYSFCGMSGGAPNLSVTISPTHC